jgi:cyclophilin family peptidyl-prolyl cis-trans isomerase
VRLHSLPGVVEESKEMWTRLCNRLRLLVLLVALGLGCGWAQATMVRLDTSLGLIDIALYDAQAPLTVANFLGYVRSGAYASSFIHRSMPGFIIQGGGYRWVEPSGYSKIPTGPPVANEFSPTRSNVRGTVAMAKLPGNPDSATSEWFVNLANNSANLDVQNGGFTVFGRVTGPGMAVFDAMAALQRISAAVFTDLPIRSLPASGPLQAEHMVLVRSATVLPAPASAADRVFDYLEAAYPQYLSPAGATSTTGYGYYYRYYPATNAYVGEANGVIYYLVPAINSNINALGALADWLNSAAEAGY